MSNFAKIISHDTRFAKMLSLELSHVGVDSFELDGNFNDSDKYFLVVDLDGDFDIEADKLTRNCVLIGFTKKEQTPDNGQPASCATVFRRPFLMSEFLAVFNGEKVSSSSHKRNNGRVKHGKPNFLTVSNSATEALWGDIKIPLSENEYKVLSLLCKNRGETVEREKIYSLLGAEDGNMGDVYICHLRRKIDNKLGLKLIYTIRGKGYMLKN